MYVIQFFGKKTMLLGGFIGMTMSHFLIALGLNFQYDYLTLVGVIGIVFSFGMSSGPITHQYCADIMGDRGMVIAAMIMQVGTLIISSIIPIVA